MFTITNSFKNVLRNKKRYIIVAILIFIISFTSIISLVINQSAQNTTTSYLEEYGNEAKIEIDPEKMMELKQQGSVGGQRPQKPDNLTYEQYEEFATSQYVQSVTYEEITTIYNEGLEVTNVAPDMMGNKNFGNEEVPSGNSFSLIGMEDLENSGYFSDSNYVLTDGEYPKKEKEILVNSSILDKNNLSIGDKISFSSSENSNINLTISGVYENISSSQVSMSNENLLFTNSNTISNFTSDKLNVVATYLLTSYKDAEAFEKELYDMGLDEMYYVNNNQTLLNQVLGPVNSTISLLKTLMIAVILIGSGILIFINLLILRERKYEIGVLRALGQSKFKVIQGLVVEILIVTCIAMFLAMLVGIATSQPISDFLISSSGTSTPTMMDRGPRNNVSSIPNVEVVTTIETSINFIVLSIIFIINILCILITLCISSYFIIRQQPNEILRERS